MVKNIKYAISVPNFGDYFHPNTLADLAGDAEKSGWDGFSHGITYLDLPSGECL